jgi:hypothetical protein
MMKARYGFIDPGAIMGVVVSLIILAVGVFAFFITIQQIPHGVTVNTTGDYDWANISGSAQQIFNATDNVSSTGGSVFNIIGIVLIIGAIMSIVGLVYNYVR